MGPRGEEEAAEAESAAEEAPKVVGPRSYVRLPDDDELLERLRAAGWVHADVAKDLGCSPSAIGKRVRAIALARPGAIPHVPRRGAARTPQLARIIALEAVVEDLTRRVEALEARPMGVRIVEFKPNHRRVADGGANVNEQRRQLKREIEKGA